KTPLTSIRMYGEMLKEGWASEEKKKTYYDFIFAESERLSRLIANVLQLARLGRDTDDAATAPVTLSEAFEKLDAILQSQAAGAQFDLITHAPEEMSDFVINVDLDNLTQVFVNLMDNAIKFSKPAGATQVELRCSLQRDKVAI